MASGFLALFPDNAGVAGTEYAVGGYARVAVSYTYNGAETDSYYVIFDDIVTFPQPTADYVNAVAHWKLYASDNTSLIASGTFDTAQTVKSGDLPVQVFTRSKATVLYLINAFTVENGTGKRFAHSYLSDTGASVLLQAHPDYESVWVPKTLVERQRALSMATLWLDRRYRFYASQASAHQRFAFPRTKLVDRRGLVVNSGSLPEELKLACALMALSWAQENLWPTISEEGAISSFSVGALSISYAKPDKGASGAYGKAFPDIDMLLNAIAQRKNIDYVDSPEYEGQP